MGRLYGTRVYQVGAMDRVPDGGVQWRENLTPFLNGLGILVFNPCDKPIKEKHLLAAETEEARQKRRSYKKQGKLKKASKLMKPIRNTDLRMVDVTDFIIANIDIDIHACGSYEEICTANQQKKPILVRIEQGKENCPDWLLAILGKSSGIMIFSTWEEMKEYLTKIDRASKKKIKKLNKHKRWVFFDLERLQREAEEGYCKGKPGHIGKDCKQGPHPRFTKIKEYWPKGTH